MNRILLIAAIATILLNCSQKAEQKSEPKLQINVQEAMRDSDTVFIWTQARIAMIPDSKRAIMTMSKKLMTGEDVYYDLYESVSKDMGKSWTEPVVIPSLKIHEIENGYRRSMSDMTPQWHAKTGKILNLGKSFFYTDDRDPDRSRREVAYAVYDPEGSTWGSFKALELPEKDKDGRMIMAPGAGCSQFIIDDNGDVIIPIAYYALTAEEISETDRSTFTVHNSMNNDKIGGSVSAVRCSFDGETLKFIEQGNSLTVKKGRGLGEPSIIPYKGKHLMTIRSDKMGYVSISEDGLNYAEPKPWTFDDGTPLGSYNTQQHLAVVNDKLYLIYTRPTGKNDHIFRHRAPLLIAEIDIDNLVVIKSSEEVCVPEKGEALGNFGVTTLSPNESWVVTSEYHREVRPSNKNRVWIAKLN